MSANDHFSDEAKIDRLLSGFFKAELPDPFPPLKLSAGRAELAMPVVSGNSDRASIMKSKLSLAASVALLLGGCWYLSGQISTPPERSSFGKGEGSAKVPKELKAKENPAQPMMP